jgi:hypothetical protein
MSTNTQILSANQLPISIEIPSDIDHMQSVLTEHLSRVSNTVNSKEGSLYDLQEISNFQQFFTQGNPQIYRDGYRFTFDLVAMNGGNIAGSATVSFPHNISNIINATRIYASCTSTTPEYFSVMYPEAKLNATQIVFTNPQTSPLSGCIFIAEYTKT